MHGSSIRRPGLAILAIQAVMKIDIFCHIFPESAFKRCFEAAPNLKDMGKRVRNVPMLFDLDLRFRVMDQFGSYRQVISMASPPLESFARDLEQADLFPG